MSLYGIVALLKGKLEMFVMWLLGIDERHENRHIEVDGIGGGFTIGKLR
jgi:hypothetical protein